MTTQRLNDDGPPWEPPEGIVPEEGSGEEPEGETPDPLEGLSEEQRAYFENAILERETAIRDQVRQGLQGYGLDLTQDGTPAIRDPRAAQGWLGAAYPQAPPAAAAAPVVQPPRSEPPAPDAMPDYYEDPRGFAAYIEQMVERRANAALAPLQEELKRTREQATRTQMNAAFSQVAQAIETYVPELAYLLDHPEFPERFQQVLSATPPEHWSQPENLAVLASTLRVSMPPPRNQPAAAPEEPRERRAPVPRTQAPSAQSQARTSLSRAAVTQASPTRGEGRGSTPREFPDYVLEAAARMGISPEEMAGYDGDTTGDAVASMRKARLDKIRGNR